MTTASRPRGSFGLLGVAGAACIACCAGPLLALLGGITIAGLAGTVLIGGLALVIAVVAGVGFVAVRSRRGARRPTGGTSVAVDAPVRRSAPS